MLHVYKGINLHKPGSRGCCCRSLTMDLQTDSSLYV